jgi:methyl-accepting chemotaxis protein
MIRTWTLRGKLMAAFSAVALLTALLAGVALLKLAELNANTVEIGENWLPSVEVLGDLESDAPRMRLLQVRQVLASDAATRSAVDRLLEQRASQFAGHSATYAKLISSQQEQQMWDQFEARWKRYIAFHNESILPLAHEGKEHEALVALFGEGLKLFDDAQGVLDKLVELNVEGGDAAVEASHGGYTTARTWLIGVSAAALLVSLALALLISGHVLRVIGGEPTNVGAAVARIAGGDLSTPVTVQAADQTSILCGIGRMQVALLRVVGEVRAGAESVASASSQIAQGNVDLSARTEEQAANLEQTAASVEQMASAVRNNADTAGQANQLATAASEVAVQGGELVQQVVSTMADISNASKRIADIIGVIDSIAFQTNILALNAAVEAARAGEHGKGFAVVASEVRNLAQRSATAAREIKGLITDSVGQVDAGSTLVSNAGRTMSEIVAQVRRVSDLMGEITAATQEQSSGIAQINTAVAQLDQTTQQNAALVEESTAASESMKAHGERLLATVSAFRLAPQAA